MSSYDHNPIHRVLESAHLSSRDHEHVRAELEGHIEELTRDMQLAGKPQKEIDQAVQRHFREPEKIGGQFYGVYHRLDRIPWIGPVLTYAPLRYGVVLLVTHFGTFFLGMYLTMFTSPLVFTRWGNMVSMIIAFLPPLIEGAVFGAWRMRWSDRGEAITLSYLPFLAALFVVAIFAAAMPGVTWNSMIAVAIVMSFHVISVVAGLLVQQLFSKIIFHTYGSHSS